MISVAIFAQANFSVFSIITTLLNEIMSFLQLSLGFLLFEDFFLRIEFFFLYRNTNNIKLTIVKLSLGKMLITY